MFQSLIKTPIGEMIAICDEKGLYSLTFTDEEKRKPHPLKTGCNQISLSIQNELKLYFEGKLTLFRTPIHLGGTEFQNQVWTALMGIPFGKTISYAKLAETIHKPKAFRAVANANGANRCPIIIPCHRIIQSNGELGGFRCGLARKIWLLKHEAEILKIS